MGELGVLAMLAVAVVTLLPGVAAAAEAPRQLILVLDGVPYEPVRAYVEASAESDGGGALASFRGPVPLISTFPSTTSVAMTGILGAVGVSTPPGYEARFFDRQTATVRGGGPISYFRIDFPWRSFFDWRGPSVLGNAIGALRSVADSKSRIDNLVDAFLASSEPAFFGHIGSTDRVGHLKSPAALIEVLEHLDRRLVEVRSAGGPAFRVTILSDHGMAGGRPLVNVAKPVRRTLAGGGYRVRKKLRRDRDVALTPYGLVSSFELYAARGAEAALARILAATDGVDLCVIADDDGGGADAGRSGWRVFDEVGEARIERVESLDGPAWSYRSLSSDPLDYDRVRVELEHEHGYGSSYSDAQWLAATSGHHYPDALARIAGGFELVHNPASVICSVAPGYMFGAKKTVAGSRISGQRVLYTHGALLREASEGFLMTECPSWPADGALRFDQGLADAVECVGAEGQRIERSGSASTGGIE